MRSNGVGLGVGVWSPVYGYGQYLMGIARALVDVDKVMSDGTARVEVSGVVLRPYDGQIRSYGVIII